MKAGTIEFQKELSEIINEFKERNIIQEATNSVICSPFFMIKQKEKLRPILDLRYLNQSLQYHHFQMENLSTLTQLMTIDSHFCKVDLKDAYLSVPILKEHQKYLGFIFQNQEYINKSERLEMMRQFPVY